MEGHYTFGDIEVDSAARLLWRAGAPVSIQRKPLDLLIYLLRHPQRVVSKDEILRELWPQEFVGESSLAVCITKIRKALGDNPLDPQIVVTVHGIGYRFVAPVETREGARRRNPPMANTLAASISPDEDVPNGRLVGRDADLTLLRAAWSHALGGRRQVIFITGEAGIGKTSLVDAFLGEVTGGNEAPRVLRGESIEQRSGAEPFTPILDAWTRACRGGDGNSIVGLLRACAPGWLLQLPSVLDTQQRQQLREECSSLMPQRMMHMLAAAFTELALQRPLIVVLEDLHWSDVESIDLLARIANERAVAPLLVLVTYRPVDAALRQPALVALADQLRLRGRSRELELARLDATAIAAFVEQHPTTLQPTSEMCSALFERTQGHPLFLRAVLDHLHDGGSLHTVPHDVRRMIQHEIEALGEPTRRALEAASLLDSELAAPLVAAALELDDEQLEERLLHLAQRRQIIESIAAVTWPDGTTAARYRFVHPLYHEVLAQGGAPERQRNWYRRIAARLAAAYHGAEDAAASSSIARYFERAGDVALALRYYEYTLTRAHEDLAHQRLVALATAALALIERLPASHERSQQELGFRVILGPALTALHGYTTAEVAHNSERTVALARELGQTATLALALQMRSLAHEAQGETSAALACAEEMAALAADLPPPMQRTTAGGLGLILMTSGQIRRAHECLEHALQPNPDMPAFDLRAHGIWTDPDAAFHAGLAISLTLLGRVDEGRERLDAALARAVAVDHHLSLATVHIWAIFVHWLRRDAEALTMSCEEACRIAVEHGLFAPLDHMRVLPQLARAVAEPRVDTAEALLNHLRGFASGGSVLTFMHCVTAEALGRSGQPQRGLEVLEEALQRSEHGGARVTEAEIYRLRGELLAALPVATPRPRKRRAGGGVDGNLAAADSALRNAIHLSREQGTTWYELRAAVSRAKLLRQQSRTAEARQDLEAIYSSFDQGIDTPDLQEARALLNGL